MEIGNTDVHLSLFKSQSTTRIVIEYFFFNFRKNFDLPKVLINDCIKVYQQM